MKYLATLLLCFLVSIASLRAQTKVKGTVVDEIGDPLIGVSVVLKGTTIGTATDIEGDFTLSIPSGNSLPLVFSYVGYVTAEYPVKSEMKIVLREDSKSLDEVVVIGYGTQRQNSLIGSISVMKAQGEKKDKKGTTWKRSGLADNSIRLQVGDDDYLPLEAAQVAVQIEGFRVRVLMDCFFFNNKKEGVEGVFKLKLPTGASPYYFAFGETEYVDEEDDDDNVIGRKVPYTTYDYEDFNLLYKDVDNSSRDWRSVREAHIVSKQKAAKAYENTVSANIDPALMEWGGADMFACRVFPLAMNTLHRVVIGYDLDMTEALDFREYIMALPKVEKDLKVDVFAYQSPSFPLEVTPSLPAYTIDDEDEDGKIPKDRVVYSLTNPKHKEIVFRYNNTEPILLIQKDVLDEDDSNTYFASNYRIELPEEVQPNLPSDAIFMLDVSLSSDPDKFNVWLTLMYEILSQNRDIIKRFAVMTFNIENNWYQRHYQRNNYYNIDQFMLYANTLALEGATDMGIALKEAANPSWLKKDKGAPKHIFLMSDADCNWGEVNKHTFRYLINKGDRIHTYKTGLSGTNMGVLDYLSRISGGYSFTVTGEEEATLTAKSFRYKPWRIENIKVEGVEDFLISGNPTQLYNGQKLIFTGRGIPSGRILIDVNTGSEKKNLTFGGAEKINTILSSRIYGQIAMSYLDNYGYKAEDAAINYSTFYRVPGQYTSFLMLENDSEYEEYGAIDDYDAKEFVTDNPIDSIVAHMESNEATASLGNAKADFLAWMERLQSDNSVIDFRPDSAFLSYVNNLPEEIFSIWKNQVSTRFFYKEQQSENEREILADQDIRFDNILKEARRRKSSHGKYAALKLLSSVIERNASDVQTTRDVAMIMTDWGMGDQAYFSMRRIIDWRQGEAISYLTAADALASTINNIDMAIVYYYICLNSDWDSDYGSFVQIAALRALKYFNKITSDSNTKLTKSTKEYLKIFKPQVAEILENDDLLFEEADIVVIVNWNVDNTDIDLHVLEPTGEECYYSNKETEIGGKLTIDVIDGYGPEMYILEKAPSGKYKIMLKYYRSSATKTASKAKAYIDVYRDWGRKNEKVTRKTVMLDNVWEKAPVMLFDVKDKMK